MGFGDIGIILLVLVAVVGYFMLQSTGKDFLKGLYQQKCTKNPDTQEAREACAQLETAGVRNL